MIIFLLAIGATSAAAWARQFELGFRAFHQLLHGHQPPEHDLLW
jgi:hypothetical protein